MKIALYPGSFDPVTKGHEDIIRRASYLFDRVIVAVGKNSVKNSLFTVTERVSMLKKVTKELPNVEVAAFDGLTVLFAKKVGATVILKGLRSTLDFENERSQESVNSLLAPEIETVYLGSSPEVAMISSTLAKEVALGGGDVSAFLSKPIEKNLKNKFKSEVKK